MKLKEIITAHLLVLILAVPHVASGEDFTFEVSIDLKNLLPDITNIKVQCFVAPDNRFLTEFLIGSGSTMVTVPSGGSIAQSVKVNFNASPGKNPAEATNVGCNLILKDRKGIESIPLRSTDSDCDKKENLARCQKSGTQFTTFISDPLP